MGIIQKDAVRTMLISYAGLFLGYLNKGVLFILILSTEEIGLINLLLSLGLLFAQLSNLGTVNSLLRFFPYFRDEKKHHHGFPQLTILIAGVGIIISAMLSVFFYDEIVRYYSQKSPLFVAFYFWVIPIGISHLLFLLLETYLKGIFKNVFAVFVKEILQRVFVTVSLFLYWFDWMTLDIFIAFNSLLYVLPFLILLWYTLRHGELSKWNAKITIPKRFRKIIVGYSLYNYVNSLGAVFILTMDAMMIAAFLGLEATGVYTTVLYLASALQVPYRSLMRVAVPLVPIYWKERKMAAMEKLYKDISSINLVVSAFLFLLVWVNIDELFTLLPQEFATGIWVFLFIMIGRTIDMYFGLNGFILLNSKRYSIDILFTLILLVIVFVLNYMLIPIYGIVGAAISTMTGLIVYNSLRLFYLLYHYKLHPFKLKNLLVFVLFGLTVFVDYSLPEIFDNWLLRVIQNTLVAGLLFVLPAYLLKVDNMVNDYFHKVLRIIGLKVNSKD